jgi:hypothetical protein
LVKFGGPIGALVLDSSRLSSSNLLLHPARSWTREKFRTRGFKEEFVHGMGAPVEVGYVICSLYPFAVMLRRRSSKLFIHSIGKANLLDPTSTQSKRSTLMY